MTVHLARADARSLPLADDTVDLVCTSPPYFGLRDYEDDDGSIELQIGSETTPAEFVDELVAVTAELVRVLKPSGSIWVNLGDKYGGAQAQSTKARSKADSARVWEQTDPKRTGIPHKSLMGLPWRYAIRCVDELGLILRAEVIWSKPNGLPESVTDRVRRSHEHWFHMTKEPRYFSAVDEIRESSSNPTRRALSAPPSRPALGPELDATFRTDHGPTLARGWCQLGSLKQSINLAVTGQAECFEVVDLVGFLLRVEGPERDYVVDLQSTDGPALDAAMSVAVERALADLAPSDPTPGIVAARPSGVLCSGAIVGDALGRAEVLGLELAPIAAEGVAARITLDLKPGRATLLVWDAFAGCHVDSLPPRSDGLGKLPGSVWTVPTEPLRVPDHIGVDHFAAFPSEWPRRLILGWSPSGVCVACGEGRRPICEREFRGEYNRAEADRQDARRATDDNRSGDFVTLGRTDEITRTITGYACACPDTTAPTRPAVVLDPFSGTGTTAAVAHILGRHGVGFDLSAAYMRLALWRATDPKLRAKVLRTTPPAKQTAGQASLFDLELA